MDKAENPEHLISSFIEWEVFILKASTVLILIMVVVALVMLPISVHFYGKESPEVGGLALMFVGGWFGIFTLGSIINLISIILKTGVRLVKK